MGFTTQLNDKLRTFIAQQQMFFTASSPQSGGRVNLSPKGIDGLCIIDDRTVAYLDLTGSGNETAAHVHENGRLTIMLCSFQDQPLILRLYGNGRIVQPRDSEWETLRALFPQRPGTRQIIVLNVESVQTSCGFGVPLYQYISQRDMLIDWAEKKGEARIAAYHHEKNSLSIDGLPTGIHDRPTGIHD
ncbi:MAG: pyridoxamine 5'-phosphate oxidase family protein [Phycisphaerales bacterium]